MRGATAGVLLLCLGSAKPQCRFLTVFGAVPIMVLQFGDQYCDNTQDSGTHQCLLVDRQCSYLFLNIKVGTFGLVLALRIQQPTVSPYPY